MAQNKRKKQHICLYLIATKYLKNNAPVEYMDSWTWTYSLVIIYWKYQKQYLTGQSFCMWIVWVYVGVHMCVCDCAEFVQDWWILKQFCFNVSKYTLFNRNQIYKSFLTTVCTLCISEHSSLLIKTTP